METHPDIIHMRNRHEMAARAASTPGPRPSRHWLCSVAYIWRPPPWIVRFNNLAVLAVDNLIVGVAYT